MSSTPASPGRALWHAYQQQLRPLAAALTVGATLGLLIGGVGGRLAMRLVFLTSDPSVAGVVSDDGFAVGQITPATLLLLALSALAGVLGVLAYLAIRPLLLGPARVRWAGPPLFLFGLPVLIIIGLAHLVRQSPRLTQALRHPAVLWSARALWAGVGAVAAFDLSRKIVTLL